MLICVLLKIFHELSHRHKFLCDPSYDKIPIVVISDVGGSTKGVWMSL